MFALVLREMRSRFGRMRLGALWVVLEPMAHMAALATLVSLRGATSIGYDFFVWLLVGIAPFLLFKNIALKLMNSVDANKSLFSYKQIQPADAFAARTIVEFCISAIVFMFLYIGLTWHGHDTAIHDSILWLTFLGLGIVFSFAFGILLALIAEAVPETKFVLTLLFLPLYFLSGIVFSLHRIPEEYMKYILWNPYLHIVDLIRESTFKHYRPYDGVSAMYVVECTIVFMFLACAIYRVRRFRLMAL
ncbi:ABC transporter permease [Bordetella genomosp. 2]|uniref:ABC transporter permease n=1 Tax=Bordetella genomosp. 2 TaxID=1983456 RepID=UPI001482832A|nr:ABC transporter permease [Bordetella genomosp. 2]